MNTTVRVVYSPFSLNRLSPREENPRICIGNEIMRVFAVNVSSLCPQADAIGQQLSRNHLPVPRSGRTITGGRTIRAWQRFQLCTGCGQTSCTVRFSTAVAMLPPQRPLVHLRKRLVLHLPSGARGGELILVPILCLAVCINHSIILSTAQIP